MVMCSLAFFVLSEEDNKVFCGYKGENDYTQGVVRVSLEDV